jgi:putative peptide zinc metalloprotease protein
MQTETPASDLERRKKVRLRLRGDLAIAPQKYEGRTYYVVKDPISLRYYRFKEHEHFLLNLMDGDHSLDDAQKAFEKRFRPDRLSLEDLEQFGQQLLTAGLAQNEAAQAGKLLFERRKKRRRSELMQTLTNILYIKIPVFDPEKLLGKMLPYFRFMFTLAFLVASVAVMLAAVLLITTHFSTFRERLPSYREFFSFKTVIYMWAALGAVKVIHSSATASVAGRSAAKCTRWAFCSCVSLRRCIATFPTPGRCRTSGSASSSASPASTSS